MPRCCHPPNMQRSPHTGRALLPGPGAAWGQECQPTRWPEPSPMPAPHSTPPVPGGRGVDRAMGQPPPSPRPPSLELQPLGPIDQLLQTLREARSVPPSGHRPARRLPVPRLGEGAGPGGSAVPCETVPSGQGICEGHQHDDSRGRAPGEAENSWDCALLGVLGAESPHAPSPHKHC